jgi:hypothetical protein
MGAAPLTTRAKRSKSSATAPPIAVLSREIVGCRQNGHAHKPIGEPRLLPTRLRVQRLLKGSSHSLGKVPVDTGLASLCFLIAALSASGTDSLTCRARVWFRPSRASHFLLLAQEKVTKEKGTPPSGPGYAGVPSFHHRSRGTPRRAIPGPSWLSRHPCRSTPYAAIPLGLLKGTWASSVRSQL